jgi:hypothetical protein
MTEDNEINSMQQVAAALTPLSEESRNRVLQWAVSRFRGGAAQGLRVSLDQSMKAGTATQPLGAQGFDTFAELFEAANPLTEKEKGLVAGYWVQICQSQPSFGSQPLNDALKDLGHGVGNITDALSALKEERPALLLQLKKSGTSKQARKTYKLTQEGIRRVHGMISGEGSPAGE